MNRELCVLVYSEFSQASRQLIEYIQSLPYDLAAVTGMSLFAADSQEARDKLDSLSINTVPCIFIKYFDGKTTLYTDNDVYAFISAISNAMPSTTHETVSSTKPTKEINIDYVEPEPLPLPEIIKRGSVMAAAMEMQKSRDEKTKKESPESINRSNLQKRTKLV